MFKTDEEVYVHYARYGDWYASKVDHMYTRTDGTPCVRLYDGATRPASSVMTYDAYWKRQRDMMALASQEDK